MSDDLNSNIPQQPGFDGSRPQPENALILTAPKPLSFDRADLLLLPAAWLLGWLFVEIGNGKSVPALGLTVFFTLLYAVLLPYCRKGGKLSRTGLIMLASLWLLSLTFSISANNWMYFLNVLAIIPLSVMASLVLNGSFEQEWVRPRVLLSLIAYGIALLFARLDAPVKALLTVFKGLKGKRTKTVILSAVVMIPVVLAVVSLLASADSIFSSVTRAFCLSIDWSFLRKPALGALIGLFIYGAFYALKIRHFKAPQNIKSTGSALDPIAPLITICALDLIYALFAFIQFAYLFGGLTAGLPEGFSYAQYARSGFFELVRVSAINLAVLLAGVTFSNRQGTLWRAQQIFSYLLAGFTGLLLFSAAYRMSMYVGAYGLSRLRALTIWGMALILVLLAAAVYKTIRIRFRFFPFFVGACMAAWLILNFCNIDGIVSRYNVDNYLSGSLNEIDMEYLQVLSPASIPSLEKLYAAQRQGHAPEINADKLKFILDSQEERLNRNLSDWRTWDLQTQLAYHSLTKNNP